MAVPSSDHSCVIGREGVNTNRIMKNCNVRIHFPDSNLIPSKIKSSKVKITGSLDGVEEARAMIRQSTALMFMFFMPEGTSKEKSTYVLQLEKKFGIEVSFTLKSCLVKGTDDKPKEILNATKHLIKKVCKISNADKKIIQMQLEISADHHAIVLGAESSNLFKIMEQTKTKITLPKDAETGSKRSKVTIKGNINDVYHARQMLLVSWDRSLRR